MIDADVFVREYCDCCSAKKEGCNPTDDPVCGAIELLNEQPTVDAVPVVHGRWEKRTDVVGFVRCSNCRDCNIYDDWADGKKWNYCPTCGAKMDGDGSE